MATSFGALVILILKIFNWFTEINSQDQNPYSLFKTADENKENHNLGIVWLNYVILLDCRNQL